MAVLVDKNTKVICERFAGAQVRSSSRATPRRMGILVAAVLALSACVESAHETPAIRASANAGPGETAITVARARAVFNDLCVTKRGSSAGTEAAAAADGFVKNTTFGTYYHPRDNLSVKLIDGDCSMVFGSREPEARLRSALTSLSTRPAPRFRLSGTLLGDPLYNVRITAR